MRPGGGKEKGGKFERAVCKRLSHWVSAGKHQDLFWRSAMSGGRATVHGPGVRQAGDAAGVTAEAHQLLDHYVIECKHVKDLYLDRFCVQHKGPLVGYWTKLLSVCIAHNKEPMLIACQNFWPPLVFMRGYNVPNGCQCRCVVRTKVDNIAVFEFDHILKVPFKRWIACHR